MNAHLSRSHVLLVTKLEKSFLKKKTNYIACIYKCGSERVNKINAKEIRLEEAKKINYSLLILGNCIQSLFWSAKNIKNCWRNLICKKRKSKVQKRKLNWISKKKISIKNFESFNKNNFIEVNIIITKKKSRN